MREGDPQQDYGTRLQKYWQRGRLQGRDDCACALTLKADKHGKPDDCIGLWVRGFDRDTGKLSREGIDPFLPLLALGAD